MPMFKAGIVFLWMVFPFSVAAETATMPDKTGHSLWHKHRVELGIGLLSKVRTSSEASAAGVSTRNEANGLFGSIGYTYYFGEDFGITVMAAFFGADARTSVSGSGVVAEAASVVPLLFGVKYQPSKFSSGGVLRPYASASIGPYFGSASSVRAGPTASTESYSETAMGLRLAIGIDLLLGRLFTFGAGLGYHLISDFENRIGAETNHSSPEFSLSFGIVFGG